MTGKKITVNFTEPDLHLVLDALQVTWTEHPDPDVRDRAREVAGKLTRAEGQYRRYMNRPEPINPGSTS